MADSGGMLSWMFRPQCAACSVLSDEPLCGPCAETLVEAGEISAVRAAPLERIVAPWRFGGQLASAIRRLKFTGATHVARTVAPLWSPVLAAAVAEGAIVVPVPLHWRRRWKRGFDQTWLLATHACALAKVDAPVIALARTRAAVAQSTLSAAERAANLVGAFAVRDARRVAGRTIVLVDDVVTTGATLSACAAPLLEAGAIGVSAVTVARER